MDEKIAHTTLAEKAYKEVRSGLISARFEPGDTLTIRHLAAKYGISMTPVREALQRLVAEKALEMQPNKSYRVPVLSMDRFNEVIRIRCALEGMAAELACPNIDARDLCALTVLVDKMDRAIKDKDFDTYKSYNEKFHFSLYESANAPLLLGMIGDLWVQVAPYFTSLFKRSAYLQKGNYWHKRILDALKTNDVQAVKAGIVGDINAAGNDLQKLLKATQAATRSSLPPTAALR